MGPDSLPRNGHNLDAAQGSPSTRPPFGNGRNFSEYGRRNGKEDFSESHQWVMFHLDEIRAGNLDDVLRRDPQNAQDPDYRAKVEVILGLYGIQPGSAAPQRGGIPHFPGSRFSQLA